MSRKPERKVYRVSSQYADCSKDCLRSCNFRFNKLRMNKLYVEYDSLNITSKREMIKNLIGYENYKIVYKLPYSPQMEISVCEDIFLDTFYPYYGK